MCFLPASLSSVHYSLGRLHWRRRAPGSEWDHLFSAGGSARIGTSSGQLRGDPIAATVTAGVFSWRFPMPLLSDPNTCYAVTVIDNSTGNTLLGAGLAQDAIHVNTGGAYGCVQPTGSTWSFDAYVPPALAAGDLCAGSWTGRSSRPTGATGGTGYSNNLLPNLTTFVCEGDSITAGTGTSSNAHRYCDVAMTLPSLYGRSITYSDQAVGGSTVPIRLRVTRRRKALLRRRAGASEHPDRNQRHRGWHFSRDHLFRPSVVCESGCLGRMHGHCASHTLQAIDRVGELSGHGHYADHDQHLHSRIRMVGCGR